MIDPICGMNVEEQNAAGKYQYDGRTYLFCSPHCLEKFKADPEKYLGAAEEQASPKDQQGNVYTCPMDPEVRQSQPGPCPKCGMALERATVAAPATRTEYVCPMHPQIVRPEPGSCPICGMALEPRTATLEGEVNPELVDMTRRFWISLFLSVPVLFVAMADMIPGQPMQQLLNPRIINWIQFVLATPVVLWGGWPFFQRGWQSIVNRSLNMFTLIAIGVGAAYFYSVVATLSPAFFLNLFTVTAVSSLFISRRRRSLRPLSS